MSVSPYESYRDSCVEWLGDVPSHWSVQKLKHFVDDALPITYGIVQAGPHVIDGIPYIRPTDMADEAGVVSSDELMRTSAQIAEGYSRSKVATGNLVVSIGPSFGKAMVAPPALDGCNLTQGTARVAVSSSHFSKFVFWALRCPTSFAQWESSVGGATFRALNLKPLAETIFPAPPLSEQAAIAAFLDRETAKIDALVEEQKRLIKLLKEKRQAVISHAVTKGLNPNAPIKDSGIEWLGEVPAHWDIRRIKHIASTISKGTTPTTIGAAFQASGVRFLKAENISDDTVNAEPEFYIAEETHTSLGRSALQEGDVLVVIAGATTGKSGVLTQSLLPANTNQAVSFIRPLTRTASKYIQLWLSTDLVRRQIEVASVQSAQPNLSMEELGNLPIPVPPESELDSIVEALATEAGMVDGLIATASAAMALLQERRSALISAAVTGKIDVRGLITVEAEAA
jgi:type I restriction enzyme S subunit